jgi:hypothetical protein
LIVSLTAEGGVVMPAALMHSTTVAQSAIVTDCSAIGFVASALVLAAFGMKDMVNLRIIAICSNFAFIAYALVLNLPPVLVLHVILLPLNGWRLAQAFQDRQRIREISERSLDQSLEKLLLSQGWGRPT